MKKKEVIIVGGGPAGSTCAYELSKAGVSTTLFDHSHPREKPCGGAIAARFDKEFQISEDIMHRRIHNILIENQEGYRLKLKGENLGITLMRQDFDQSLLKKAVENGTKHINQRVVDVKLEGKRWVVKTQKKIYYADCLIGADGCDSLVRQRTIGPIPKEYLGQCVGYHIPHDREYMLNQFEDALELYFISRSTKERGYIWIFPKLDYITVGLGIRLGTPKIKETLDKFIMTHQASKKIKFSKGLVPYSHLIPFISSPQFYNLKTSGKNWVVVGDAAGHVNPITGEGIFYAMMGGRLAARAYLDGDICLFEKYWRKKYGGDLYWGARLQKVFYNPKVLRTIIKRGAKSETLREIVTDIIATRIDYDILFKKKILIKLPSIIKEMFV